MAVELVVVKLNLRHRPAYRLVPCEFSFFHKRSCRYRREQFRIRRNRLHRLRRERQLLLVIAIAVALGEHQLVSDNNSYADTWRVPVLQRLLHVSVKALQLLRNIRFLSSRSNALSKQSHSKHAGGNEMRRGLETKLACTNHKDTPSASHSDSPRAISPLHSIASFQIGKEFRHLRQSEAQTAFRH